MKMLEMMRRTMVHIFGLDAGEMGEIRLGAQ
jgi:hypothetical protein